MAPITASNFLLMTSLSRLRPVRHRRRCPAMYSPRGFIAAAGPERSLERHVTAP